MMQYTAYFRDLATRHKRILHDPANEGTGAMPGSCRFATFTTDDVATGAKASISGGFVVLLHDYEYGFSDNETGDFRKDYTGGLMITRQARAGDVLDQEAAMDECEEILRDFIAHLRKDHNQTPSFQNAFGIIDWNKASVQAVSGLWNNRYGWWLSIEFQKKDKTIDDPATVAAAFNP